MTRLCVGCERNAKLERFENESFTISHAGATVSVPGLSGWRCDACGEVEFDPDSARRYAAAGDELVMAERARQASELRRIRKRLGINQRAAARLTD